MTARLAAGSVLILAVVSAGCTDRTAESYRVYDAVLAAMSAGVIQLLQPPADAYFRVRNERRGLERRFQTTLPYELVGAVTGEERFPGGVVTFSPVGFSRSGRQALVFVSHYCGVLCGSGHFVLLSAHPDGWRIERARLMVMS